MAQTLIARGQATITIQKDGYTITQSLGEYIFPADQSGKILSAVSVTSTISVTLGDSTFSNFTIGTISKPTGFSSISVNNTNKTVTFAVAANTTTLADHGKVEIPIVISGTTYKLTFVWSKAKKGDTGAAGVDANLLDWVKEWNTGKTLINSNTVITPKLFAGAKNTDGTISGVAIGSFALSTKTSSGTITTETVNGIYGFKDGYKTFYVDNSGNAQLGYGNEYIKYDASTGKIEFGSAVSMQWVGATYIDKDGIFTGTLSADTISAIDIAASQITSGKISATYINTDELKSTLITASNINALTLTTTKGTIGGWKIDSDSIYRGTKKNTAATYTAASGSMTIGSTGIRGYKWRLESTGAGAVAGGNISWDASGNVTFANAVSLNWTEPIGEITDALGGDEFPKLTKITAEGIYTGSITASQITAGTISADRIAAGSISADKLDAASIKSDIINTTYINGLECTFTKGKIGGWTIGSSTITASHIAIDSGNKRFVVYGANASATSGARVQMYYNSDSDYGLLAINSSGYTIASLGSSNKIAGWALTSSAISKGNVSLGSDGSITNGTKWKLNNDGSGQIASGNISWNAAGAVTFSDAVALNWQNDIDEAQKSNFGYPYYHKVTIYGDADTYYPVVLKGGDQNFKRDILIRRSYGEQAPSTWHTSTHKGGLVVLLKANFGGWGGIAYSWDIYELSETYCNMFAGAQFCGNYCMFAVFLRGGGDTGAVYHIYSNQPIESTYMSPDPIPAAPHIAYESDLVFQSGTNLAYAPAPRSYTDNVQEEIRRRRFINLAQSNDSTLTAHPLTYISSTGIYTGTLTANQVNAVAINASSITAGTLSADRIAAGSISAAKLDAASIKSDIINTSYINGLSCTFTKGTIGGWTIAANKISKSQIVLDGANKRIVVYSTSSTATSGQRVQIFYNSDTDFGFWATNSAGTCIAALGSTNKISGWALTASSITKGNVSLGSDGSITNGAKWKLNNDGSGQIASGNISWNASGTVTFGATVKTQWTTGITTAKELASAMAFGKMLYRDPTFFNGKNSIGLYNNAANGTVAHTRMSDSTAPNDSKYVIKIETTGSATPGNGGFFFGTTCSNRKVLIARIIAKIPTGHNLQFATNSIGTGGSSRWLTANAGTGDWCEYIYKVVCGISNFSTTHYYYLDGTQGTTDAPVVWQVAFATVFDLTSAEKYTTTIDANGVYTGTVKANQVIIDSALVVGGSSYNGSVSVRDANNSVKVTLDRTGITAVAGKIGGWAIGSSSLTASAPSSGHRIVMTSSGYIYHDNPNTGIDYWGLKSDGSATFGTNKIKFNADGSGFVANGNLSWDVDGNITAQKGTFKDVEVIGTVRNPFILNDSSIYIGMEDPQMNFNKYDHVVAIRGSWDEDIPLPWNLEHSGRRVCLVNYKWGSNTTVGVMSITAPSGKYFYEDGISKSTITFSRELVELLGYGDNTTFFGWIVVNRLDLMTSKKYGKNMKFLAQGTVTVSSTSSYSVKYQTFDGNTITVSRLGKGQYRVYLPSGWNMSGYYQVFLSGIYSAVDSTPIYATLKALYSYYFDVYTADDSSTNDGSFNFLVVSTGDWK